MNYRSEHPHYKPRISQCIFGVIQSHSWITNYEFGITIPEIQTWNYNLPIRNYILWITFCILNLRIRNYIFNLRISKCKFGNPILDYKLAIMNCDVGITNTGSGLRDYDFWIDNAKCKIWVTTSNSQIQHLRIAT